MHRPPRSALVAVLLITAALPASAQKGAQRLVVPTIENVTSSIEPGNGEPPSQFFYVSNGSTIEIIVNSITLYECQNIRGNCGTQKVRIRVPGGARVMLRKIDPRYEDQGSTFRISFTWHPDSSDAKVMKMLEEAGLSFGPRRIEREHGDTIFLAPSSPMTTVVEEPVVVRTDEALEDGALEALGDRLQGIRARPDSVVMHVGDRLRLQELRVLALDKDGVVLGRVAGFAWRVTPGVLMVQDAGVVAQTPGRTTIDLRLRSPLRPLVAQVRVIVLPD